jgi:hypothetical protein
MAPRYLHYLQRCPTHFVAVHLESFVHWSLWSSSHTMTSLHWGHNAVCRETIFMLLWHVYTRTVIVHEQNKTSSKCHGVSLLYRLYNTGAGTKPWGTHAANSLEVKNLHCTKTLNFLLVRQEEIGLMTLVKNCNSDSLYNRPECHTVSKAFSMFKNSAATDKLLLKLKVTGSISLIDWSVMLWCARKPNWLAYSNFLSSVCFWIVLTINFLNCLPLVEKGLKFWVLVRFQQSSDFCEVRKLKTVIQEMC